MSRTRFSPAVPVALLWALLGGFPAAGNMPAVAAALAPLHSVRLDCAEDSYNFDWDSNVFYQHSPIVLWDAANQRKVVVDRDRFEKIHPLLGKKGTPYEFWEFRPGKEAFEYYGDTTELGDRAFPEGIEQALQHPTAYWQGPAWDEFARALQSPESARWVTIITARGHSREAMTKGLQLLQAAGMIRYLPPPENIYPMTHPSEQRPGETVAQAKARIMKTLLDRLNEAPIGPRKHRWVFTDDTAENIAEATKVLSPEVKAGRWPNVEVILVHTAPHKYEATGLEPDGTLKALPPDVVEHELDLGP